MQSIIEKISFHAGSSPAKTAVIAEGQAITYGELFDRIKAFCCFVKENNVKTGGRVIVKASHTIGYAIACYGIHAAGGVLVPVEKNLAVKGVGEIAKDVEASLIISNEDPDVQIPFLNMDTVCRKVETYLERNYEITCFPQSDMTADILFTTGTTGKSKGVLISHKSLMTMAQTSIEGTEMGADNVYLVTVPMNHAGGIRKLHMTMYNGSTIVLMDGLMRIKQFFQYIEQYKVTSIYLPPSAVRMVMQLGRDAISKYNDQLQFIYTGSAAYPETDKEKFCALLPDVRLYNGYGGSEIGSVCMLNYNKYKGKIGCIGRPNDMVEVRIVDENRHPISSSHENIGLLAIHSDMNMQSYWNEPELTKETMADGWIYTSDLGYIDPEGFIYLTGRAGDVINVGGLKVAPTEVEETALRFEDIKDCICSSAEDKRMGKVVKLYVVMKEGHAFDAKAIQDFLRQYLEAYKVPKLIETIDEVPRTYNGKIDRKRLQG